MPESVDSYILTPVPQLPSVSQHFYSATYSGLYQFHKLNVLLDNAAAKKMEKAAFHSVYKIIHAVFTEVLSYCIKIPL